MKKILFTIMICVVPQLLFAQIKINSEPSGAKVYREGEYIGTTPCNTTSNKKNKELVYDIDANKVKDPSKPPYSIEFTIILDGYEPATVYFEGKYDYHESGWGYNKQKYYIVKPKSYNLFAVLKKDNTYQIQQTTSNNEQQNQAETKQTTIIETAPDIRWIFDSEPDDAKIFWKVRSSVPDVRNTELLYLGKTPFKETKPLNIKGLNRNNSDKVEVEIEIVKKGYIKQKKVFSGNSLIDQQELSWFFELIEEPTLKEPIKKETEPVDEISE